MSEGAREVALGTFGQRVLSRSTEVGDFIDWFYPEMQNRPCQVTQKVVCQDGSVDLYMEGFNRDHEPVAGWFKAYQPTLFGKPTKYEGIAILGSARGQKS